jgi:hypothetical protein
MSDLPDTTPEDATSLLNVITPGNFRRRSRLRTMAILYVYRNYAFSGELEGRRKEFGGSTLAAVRGVS